MVAEQGSIKFNAYKDKKQGKDSNMDIVYRSYNAWMALTPNNIGNPQSKKIKNWN
jgi:hypothetical protein